jgi:hypothetical protein
MPFGASKCNKNLRCVLARDATEEYGREVALLCGRLLAAMSSGLGVGEGRLQEEFGGEEGAGVCVRVNYYPRCPQPELTLGLSSHSDPGGMTVLLADERVRGLQVRGHGGEWVTVDPVADAFIVNVGDQIQVTKPNQHTCVPVISSAPACCTLACPFHLYFSYFPNGKYFVCERFTGLVSCGCHEPLLSDVAIRAYVVAMHCTIFAPIDQLIHTRAKCTMPLLCCC